jgi:hypothetical protein
MREVLALGRGLAVMPLQHAGGLEDAVDAGWAAGDEVAIEHHEGQAAVPLQGEGVVKSRIATFSAPVSQWSREIQALYSLTLP